MSDVYVQIYRDAENGEFVLRNVDETGALIADLPSIQIKLDDLQYATELLALFRRVHYTDLAGAKKRCYGLLTKPEDDATDDGHSSDTEDLYLGGGGGATRYRVKAVYGDYLMCHTWDGTTEGAMVINVAKPFKLRHSITTETIEGTEVDYTYMTRTNNLDGQREAIANPDTVPSTAQVEIVQPVYIVDDEILVTTPAGGTGVAVASVAVTLEDVNADARAWCQVD